MPLYLYSFYWSSGKLYHSSSFETSTTYMYWLSWTWVLSFAPETFLRFFSWIYYFSFSSFSSWRIPFLKNFSGYSDFDFPCKWSSWDCSDIIISVALCSDSSDWLNFYFFHSSGIIFWGCQRLGFRIFNNLQYLILYWRWFGKIILDLATN